MASELLKNKALIQKLKEPDVPRVKFDLASTGFEELFTLPEPKPQELLDIQEENRKSRLLESLNKIGGRLEDTSLDFIKKENFNNGGRTGFYEGMAAKTAPRKLKLQTPRVYEPIGFTKEGKPKYDYAKIRKQDPDFLGKLKGGGSRSSKDLLLYKPGTKKGSLLNDAFEIRNVIMKEKGNIFSLEDLGDKVKFTTKKQTKNSFFHRSDQRRVRDALTVALDTFPEIANFKFVPERYPGIINKDKAQLNMVVDTIKAYRNLEGEEKLAQFLPKNMGMYYEKIIEKGPKKLPGKPVEGVFMKFYRFNPSQIKYITDRITEETGQVFTSKDYKNLVSEVREYRNKIGALEAVKERLEPINEQIKILNKDKTIQNLLKGDLDRPTQIKLLKRATEIVGGDVSIASRRLMQMAEAMSDTSNKYKNLGIMIENDKANKIIDTGRNIGGVSNRYAMSSAMYQYYGNVVDNALNATEGRTFIGKYQQGIKKLLDQGRSPDEIFSLTASARRGLSPYAIFTQSLRTDVNSAIKGSFIDSALSTKHKQLQEIFKGRKYNQLNVKEKEAANKLVKQFEQIKKEALNKPINPSAVKQGAKPIYLTAEEKKNIKLPEFDLKNPPSKAIANYKNFDLNLKKAFDTSYNRVGYSMKVPKEYLTQKQMLTSLKKGIKIPTAEDSKNIAKKLASFGFKCSASEGGACDNPMNYLKDIKKQQVIAQGSGNAAASAAKKLSAGRAIFREVLGPAALGFELAAAVPITYLGYKAGLPPARIIADATYGLFGDTETARLKKIAVKENIDTADIQKALDFEKASGAMMTLAKQENEFRGPDDEMLFPQQYEKGEEDFYKAVGAFRDKEGNISKEVFQTISDQLKNIRGIAADEDAARAAEREAGIDYSGIGEYLTDGVIPQEEPILPVFDFQEDSTRMDYSEGSPKDPSKRTFLKFMAGIASLPFVGKFFKAAKAPKVVKLANTSTTMPDWFPTFVEKAFERGIVKRIDADIQSAELPELPGIEITKHDDGRVFVGGKNEYGKTYEIEYEPPGYVVIDEETGKAVKKPGEFIAQEEVPVNVDPDGNADFDVEVVEDLDNILGPDTRAMEEFATGKKIEEMKSGEFAVGKAEADMERALEEAAELDEID